LFELTKLPTEVLQAKLKDGSINPTTERRHVTQWRRERRGQVEVDGEEIKRQTTAEQLKAARAEIETLKAKLKSSGGSLFDLKADGVKEIAEVIAASVPEGKASALASAITAAVKERKRKRQAPAG